MSEPTTMSKNLQKDAARTANGGSLRPGCWATWWYETIGIKDGKWTSGRESAQVRVMAIAEGYAMVRRKGAMPFVASIKELSPNDPSSATAATKRPD